MPEPNYVARSKEAKMVSGSMSEGHVPEGAPAPDTTAPPAPDIGGAPEPALSGLGGNVGEPAKPHEAVGARIANFVSGGQATPGSVWRGILGGALTGMVAGAGTGHAGPGAA